MPVVKTTSPVAASGAPHGDRRRSACRPQQDVRAWRRSCGAQHDRPLAVGDRARGDRQQHAALQLCGPRSSSSPSGSRSRSRPRPTRASRSTSTRFAGSPTAIRGTSRSSRPRPEVSFSTTSASVEVAGHDEVGVDRGERRLQAGRAHRRLLERAPPSRRARAARGRSRCSRSTPSRRPSMSAWRSLSARSGGFILRRVSSVADVLVGHRAGGAGSPRR